MILFGSINYPLVQLVICLYLTPFINPFWSNPFAPTDILLFSEIIFFLRSCFKGFGWIMTCTVLFLFTKTYGHQKTRLRVSEASLPLTLCTRACHLVHLNFIDCFLFTAVLWSVMLCDHFDGITVDSRVTCII